MTFNEYIESLTHLMKQPLPGASAQYIMAPEFRQNYPQLPPDDTYREGAVLVLFYPSADGQPNFALTMRQNGIGIHSNQISLPGGKSDADDLNTKQTALRETYEEIGVPANSIHIIGLLSYLYIPFSNFVVYPYLGYMLSYPEFKIQTAEVAELYDVNLSQLFNPDNQVLMPIEHSQKLYHVPACRVGNAYLWGATAMILSELNQITSGHLHWPNRIETEQQL